MKIRWLAPIVLSLSFGVLHANDKPLTAFETLKRSNKLLGGDAANNLLSMESEHGHLRPRYWWIRYYDPTLFLKLRAIKMIGPEMNRNEIPGNPFDGGDKNFIIPPENLKYDSEKCIAFMEKAAKESNIPLHSLNARLDKPHPGESNPIWFFEWFDDQGKSLGSMSISAATGKVTEIVGLKIKATRFKSVSKKTFSENVSDTFLGVGADMEEFFTGKRTVDQDDASRETSAEGGKSKN